MRVFSRIKYLSILMLIAAILASKLSFAMDFIPHNTDMIEITAQNMHDTCCVEDGESKHMHNLCNLCLWVPYASNMFFGQSSHVFHHPYQSFVSSYIVSLSVPPPRRFSYLL